MVEPSIQVKEGELNDYAASLDSVTSTELEEVSSSTTKRPKVYVVDTNSIIDNPNCLVKLGEGGNCVVLPTPVLYELDKHAKSKDPQKYAPARDAHRIMRELRRAGKIYHRLEDALKTDAPASFDNGGKFSWTGSDYKPVSTDIEADDQILEQTMAVKKKYSDIADVIFVTEDISLSLKADSQNIQVEELRIGKAKIREPDQVYSGMTEFFVSRELLDKFLKSGEGLEKYLEFSDLKLDQEKLGKKIETKLIYNQGIVLIDRDKTNDFIPTIYKPELNRLECLKYTIGVNTRNPERTHEEIEQKGKKNELFYQHFYLRTFFDTQPRNMQQLFYMEHLMNPNIFFLVVHGRSGTGKTRLAMAASLHHLLKEDRLLESLKEKEYTFGKRDILTKKEYKKGLLILKPEIPAIDYGFLPGGLEDKIDPYLKAFYDEIIDMTEKYNKGNFNFLEHLRSNKILQSEATAFLRGRSLGDRITIIDEMQNGNRALAKLYISRLDHGSKNIAMGDINQIDNTHVGVNNNALTLLTHVIQQRPKPEVAVIKLEKTQRLTLAGEYEDLLSK